LAVTTLQGPGTVKTWKVTMTAEASRRLELAGRSALVTGASGGIGSAIAEALSANGAKVILHGLVEDEALRAARDRCLTAGGGHVALVTQDLADSDFDGEAFVGAVHAIDPEVDLLVNCAGAHFDLPFLHMSSDRFDMTWRLNVRSGYLIALALAKRWVRAQRPGRMLFIGSINGQLAEPISTAYDISKAAVHGMVRSLCVELAPHGIRVNGLAPGLVRTPATAWLENSPDRAKWAAWHTPNHAIPGPDACAHAAVFLLSDGAEHVQGHILNVDGGLAALQFPDVLPE
jgi:glucose 1-dehydrogenase